MAAELVGAFATGIAVMLASLFAFTAVEKFMDPAGVRISILDYRLFRSRKVVGALAVLLTAGEFVVALTVVVDPRTGAALAIAVLAAYSLAIVSALVRHLSIDCHCGPTREAVGQDVLRRNLLLMCGAAYLVYATPTSLYQQVVAGTASTAMLAGLGMGSLTVGKAFEVLKKGAKRRS